MNLDLLQRKLLAAARSTPPDDAVPYAFEQRIIARLAAAPRPDAWTLWNRALWRAAAACVALALLSSAWSLRWGAPEPSEFSEDFENAVFVMAEPVDELP